jgi:hypothetical protein
MPPSYVVTRNVSTDTRRVGGTAGAVELRATFPKGRDKISQSHISVPHADEAIRK